MKATLFMATLLAAGLLAIVAQLGGLPESFIVNHKVWYNFLTSRSEGLGRAVPPSSFDRPRTGT